MTKKKNCLIFLYRGGVSIYIPDLPDVIPFLFPETLVKDIDVINREELLAQIVLLFQTNSINSCNFNILVWDDVLFRKDFENLPVDKKTEGIKEFINSVPFEYVITKETLDKGITSVYVTNKELIEVIMAGCEKSGNIVQVVAVAHLVGEDIDWTNGFNTKIGETLVHKSNQVKQASIMEGEKSVEETPTNTTTLPFYKKKENRRSIILAGVFLLLIIVLIIVYFVTSNTNSTPTASATPTNTNPIPVATATTQPVSNIINPEELKVQVRTTSTEKFTQIKTTMESVGVVDINMDPTNITPGSRTILMLDSSIAPGLQNTISENLESLYPSITIQIITILPNHVIIIPGE